MTLIQSVCFLLIIGISGCTNEGNVDSKNIKKEDIGDNRIINFDSDWEFKTKKALEYNENALGNIKNSNLDLAVSNLRQAKLIEPRNPVILNNLGLAYFEQKEFGKSANYLNRAISYSDSNYLGAIVNMAKLSIELKQPSKTIDLCNYVLQRATNDEIIIAGYTNWIFGLFQLNRYDEASELFNLLNSIYGSKEGSSANFILIRQMLEINQHLIIK